MPVSDVEPDGPKPKRTRAALTFIQQKLERVLHHEPAVARYRTELTSIIDALSALNRDSSSLRAWGHRGENETD